MNVPRHIDEVSWVFRLNEDDADAFRPVINASIDRLIAIGDDIPLTATKYLLEAMGDPTAQAKLDILEAPEAAPTQVRERWADPRDPASALSEIERVDGIDGTQLWMHHRQSGDADLRFSRDMTSIARVDPKALERQ